MENHLTTQGKHVCIIFSSQWQRCTAIMLVGGPRNMMFRNFEMFWYLLASDALNMQIGGNNNKSSDFASLWKAIFVSDSYLFCLS